VTRAEAARLVDYHSVIAGAMTAERTVLDSALIPVTNYILVSAMECWYRHPEMVPVIDAALPAEAIGRAGRRPGQRVNHVHLWSIANIYLTGRKLLVELSALGLLPDFVDDPDRTVTVLDFWQRAAAAYRGDDGTLQAWDAGGENRPYDDGVVAQLLASTQPVAAGDEQARVSRFLGTLYAYLFLLYFDTRVGTGDTGPYPLPDGRTLLVRDFYRLGPSDFWWSEVAAGMPYHDLTAAIVLDGVKVRCNDWGTSVTDPEDYAGHIVGFGLCTTDTPDRSLEPVPLSELDGIVAAVRAAQAAHYRAVAAMSRDEKIRCGAYVYFSFLRPFAEVAGVADRLDWEVPKASAGPLYDTIANLDLATLPPGDPDAPYYPPLPV
jgi:hypothetical protein